ncbi:hypothetical protein FQA47_001040 [Oryzias melastigma]|uniref:Uncharacterized protein n=1 Tax=Oryzias melastigma TaxID=30732 RepID=A0A834FNE5_ORYME|nr:hypothetical protein FQA47_001040 [Oryzias melastigma]
MNHEYSEERKTVFRGTSDQLSASVRTCPGTSSPRFCKRLWKLLGRNEVSAPGCSASPRPQPAAELQQSSSRAPGKVFSAYLWRNAVCGPAGDLPAFGGVLRVLRVAVKRREQPIPRGAEQSRALTPRVEPARQSRRRPAEGRRAAGNSPEKTWRCSTSAQSLPLGENFIQDSIPP